MLYRKYADTSVCRDTGNTRTPDVALTSVHTTGLCPTSSASPWEMTQGQPSHRGVKYTPLRKIRKEEEGGEGVCAVGTVRGQRGEHVSVKFGDGKCGGKFVRETPLWGAERVLIREFECWEMELKEDYMDIRFQEEEEEEEGEKSRGATRGGG